MCRRDGEIVGFGVGSVWVEMEGIGVRAASELARGHCQKGVSRYATYISLLSWKKGEYGRLNVSCRARLGWCVGVWLFAMELRIPGTGQLAEL